MLIILIIISFFLAQFKTEQEFSKIKNANFLNWIKIKKHSVIIYTVI